MKNKFHEAICAEGMSKKMKLTARKDATLDNDYVDVRYRELTPEIHKIFQICENIGSIFLCEKNGSEYRVDANDVLYVEWVDSRCFIYTKDDVFTMPIPLKQLEEALEGRNFARISRNVLVNVYKVQSVSNGLNFRLTIEMTNGEKIVVNRTYRSALLGAIQELAEKVSNE